MFVNLENYYKIMKIKFMQKKINSQFKLKY